MIQLNFEKYLHFKAMGGAMMEGRMAGRKNGWANGGASFGIHGGALDRPTQHFIAKKR